MANKKPRECLLHITFNFRNATVNYWPLSESAFVVMVTIKHGERTDHISSAGFRTPRNCTPTIANARTFLKRARELSKIEAAHKGGGK